MITLLEINDYDAWLKLAEEVEPLFGPMVDSKDFREGIKDCIGNRNAYGVKDESGVIAGIIALNRSGNEILWLAVGEKHRGNRYGEKLVQKVIEELEINGDIFVQTFAAEIEGGKSARRIFEKNGFVEFKDAGKNPAGIETVIMVRKRK